ncbi:MAG: site-specific tyrosine recombinase XerD [Rhodobacteraceae bacterium]|jgi:integrase/recombinase XerD|nr:site-specific tyrosine recombinase XerD [Paracoccaceae bacterium]
MVPQGAARWISVFLEARAAEMDAARNTRLAYGRDLLDLADWLQRKALDFMTAGRADIEAYLIFCEAQGLSQATRARRLSAIKQLFRFAHDEGWRSDHPALRIAGPGRSKALPKTLSQDEVTRLLTAASTTGRTAGDRLRNLCLMELLYATGMRVTELVTLPMAAVRGDPRMILVRGKGDKERMVPLSPPARSAVQAWLSHRDAADAAARAQGHGQAASRYLFPGSGADGHLTRQYFHSLIKDIAVAAGVSPGRVTPHTLRHAFATHLLAGGADLRVIQTLLGHADIATTEIYTHVVDDHLRDLVLTRHPLAKASRQDD